MRRSGEDGEVAERGRGKGMGGRKRQHPSERRTKKHKEKKARRKNGGQHRRKAKRGGDGIRGGEQENRGTPKRKVTAQTRAAGGSANTG